MVLVAEMELEDSLVCAHQMLAIEGFFVMVILSLFYFFAFHLIAFAYDLESEGESVVFILVCWALKSNIFKKSRWCIGFEFTRVQREKKIPLIVR